MKNKTQIMTEPNYKELLKDLIAVLDKVDDIACQPVLAGPLGLSGRDRQEVEAMDRRRTTTLL